MPGGYAQAVQATRPWYKKKRWWLVAGILVIIGASVAGGSDIDSEPTADDTSSQSSDAGEKDEAPSAKKAKPKKAEKAEPAMTAGQENALGAAENYLSFAPFSRRGLINQLSSDAGDGYARKDAVFAANHVGANWNEQAAKAAKNYLEMTSFSRQDLIEQLSSDAGDKYTLKQATYGVNKAGL